MCEDTSLWHRSMLVTYVTAIRREREEEVGSMMEESNFLASYGDDLGQGSMKLAFMSSVRDVRVNAP